MLRVSITSLVAVACAACSGDSEADKANRRLWGRDPAAAEVAQRAKETLDPYGLDTDEKLRKRVLEMDFEEVVQRIGFVEYKGVAKFNLSAGGRELAVVEDTTIEHGLHGSFRVLQLDENGTITRETIYDNGVFYVRNGPGEMRVQGVIDDQHLTIRDEAWQPLRVYSSYYGPRLGLTKVGSSNANGRSAAHYKLGLVPGPELVSVKGIDGEKKPLSLRGDLWVDEATGVPLKVNLQGTLEIPALRAESAGRIELSLESNLRSVAGVEIKPKKFIPTIKRRKPDLEPLAFLDGGTRTSTVIGGKPVERPPDEISEGGPRAKTSTAAKATTPAKTKKKKKKKQ